MSSCRCHTQPVLSGAEACPIDVEFRRLAKKAREAFDALTPEQQAEHRRQQAISFAYGNCKLSNPNVTREMAEEAYDRLHPPSQQPEKDPPSK